MILSFLYNKKNQFKKSNNILNTLLNNTKITLNKLELCDIYIRIIGNYIFLQKGDNAIELINKYSNTDKSIDKCYNSKNISQLHLYTLIALNQFNIKNYKTAINYFLKSIPIKKKTDSDIFKFLGISYYNIKDYKNTIKYYELTRNFKKNNLFKNDYAYLSRSYYEIKDYERSLEILYYMKKEKDRLKLNKIQNEGLEEMIKDTLDKINSKKIK